MYLGDLADLVRNIGEDIVVERVATDKVAKSSERCKFFFDVVFNEKHVAGLACREPKITVMWASSWRHEREMMSACPLSLSMVARLSAPMLLIMA